MLVTHANPVEAMAVRSQSYTPGKKNIRAMPATVSTDTTLGRTEDKVYRKERDSRSSERQDGGMKILLILYGEITIES